jgi:NDP-sugar pyrophosphorylase family protein
MQAVILAGGLGTRLRPLTNKVPKVMASVRGNEFLWYLLRWLERNQVSDVVICAAYLWEAIGRKVSSFSRPGMTVRLSIERQPLGTAGAVKHAEALLHDEFFLINGDTYLPLSYGEIVSHWQEIREQFACLLVLYSNREKIAPNDSATDGHGVVIAYSKRSCDGMEYVNAGLAVAKKSIFAALPEDVPASLEEDVFPELISRRKIAALVTDTRYYDIGTPDRVRAFEEYLDDHPEAFSGETTG